ncbi:MAG: hypothetical protein ACRD1E_02620, partial [Terriglobales bacterium]
HQVEQYQQRLTLAPLPASQLAALEADQQQAQASYQVLSTKLSASQMASQLEQRQGGAQFRLINSPDLPRQPIWPKPAVLSLLGLAAGLGLGVGACALAELGRDRISGEAELLLLGISPVLAFVPTLPDPAARRRRRARHALEWAAGTGLILVLALGNVWLWRPGP